MMSCAVLRCVVRTDGVVRWGRVRHGGGNAQASG